MTQPPTKSSQPFWLLAKLNDVTVAEVPAFLAQGAWQSPEPDKHVKELQGMAAGDRVALKSVATRRQGLPFFNADKPVSVMTIHASGVVTSVDADSGAIQVSWQAMEPARDWYFFTYTGNCRRVDPSADSWQSELAEFIFAGADQPMEPFLADPYWAQRYPPAPRLTWIPFYEEFATGLLGFRDDRPALVQHLVELAVDEPLLSYLVSDRSADGAVVPISDIDPFTVIGSFNRGITEDNRRSIAAALAERFGVTAALPDDFHGIPILNNQNSWFVTWAATRKDGDIPALWRVLAAGLALADGDAEGDRAEFVAAYDAARQVRGVRWNLSTGLYWVRPRQFPTLDMLSRAYLREHFSIGEPEDGDGYLNLRDGMRQRFADGSTSITSFPLLSYTAWSAATAAPIPHTVEGFAYWATRMAEDVDLDETEHGYKRVAAGHVAQARQQLSVDDTGWVDTFIKGMNATNTLDFRFKDDMRQVLRAAPEQAAEVMGILWQRPDPDALDGFQQELGRLLGHVTPANATGLGSLVLMSVDPQGNAPYSWSRTNKWYGLTGFPSSDHGSSATSRYRTMLAFLDDLASELGGITGDHWSRLEAQGAAWATTEHPIPDSWDPADAEALRTWRGEGAGDTRAWLIRTSSTDVTDWLEGGYVSLPATNLGDVEPGSDAKTVKAAVETGYQHVDYSQRTALATEYHFFLTQMKPGDLVATKHADVLHIGVVESGAEYSERAGDRLRRKVSWRTSTDSLGGVQALLERQGTVVDITSGLDALNALLETGGPISPPPVVPPPPPPTLGPLWLPPASAALTAGLHFDAEPLQEILDLLESRRQIVFYGPPGTGKTYIAMALAKHIIGPDDDSRAQLVQFHPSYAYEDFFEGYRPSETDSGQATFELRPGPLRRIASEASANPRTPFVLVIDELNRANLAKVFGELYFLLEYRKESINLQYNPAEAFRLPPNLFFIGTMNTADRSIALLDAAMRRRFAFVELHPDEPPVREVLPRWLAANHKDADRALLLAALNAAIDDHDRDMRIGPSYLMRDEADTEAGLARIWKYDILPLLEEHYYGRLTREQIRQRFGLDALRSTLAAGSASEENVIDDSADPFAGLPGPEPEEGA